MDPTQATTYRRITIGDPGLLATIMSDSHAGRGMIDERTSALVCVAALIAADAEDPAYLLEIREALGAGVTAEQITGVLLAVARIAGSARVMSAAPRVAMALGYDVERGLEDSDAWEGDL
jgi:4-carboxymuconolactone decarboxylase